MALAIRRRAGRAASKQHSQGCGAVVAVFCCPIPDFHRPQPRSCKQKNADLLAASLMKVRHSTRPPGHRNERASVPIRTPMQVPTDRRRTRSPTARGRRPFPKRRCPLPRRANSLDAYARSSRVPSSRRRTTPLPPPPGLFDPDVPGLSPGPRGPSTPCPCYRARQDYRSVHKGGPSSRRGRRLGPHRRDARRRCLMSQTGSLLVPPRQMRRKQQTKGR